MSQQINGDKFVKSMLAGHRNVLLVNPPVDDYRLEWARWHQPTGLLKIGQLLHKHGLVCRLIDCLLTTDNRIAKTKLRTKPLDGHQFSLWRFGLPLSSLKARIAAMSAEPWVPDLVLVTSLNTIWWRAAQETISAIRASLPGTPIILGGAYPSLAPAHALANAGADLIVTGAIPETADLSPDFNLYSTRLRSASIQFYADAGGANASSLPLPRDTKAIVEDIRNIRSRGTQSILFIDEQIRIEDRDRFADLLNEIGSTKATVRFVMPGNVMPDLITPGLAKAMKNANVREVYLGAALDFNWSDKIGDRYSVDVYREATEMLTAGGHFRERTGAVTAFQYIGLPFESVEDLAARLIDLSHVVGSVIPLLYQYTSGLHSHAHIDLAMRQDGHFGLEDFNSKLYPMARLSGKSIQEYLDLGRLSALLNSKFRSKTFDFLGGGLASTLFRETLDSGTWNRTSQPSSLVESAAPAPIVRQTISLEPTL